MDPCVQYKWSADSLEPMDERTGSHHMPSYQEDFDTSADSERAQTSIGTHRAHAHDTSDSPAFTDPSDTQVHRQPYAHVPRQRPAHKHMGTATNDPDYLPPVTSDRAGRTMNSAPRPVRQQGDQPVNYARYLEVPKSNKAIFTRREHGRRRMHMLIALVAAIIILIVLLWLFVFR